MTTKGKNTNNQLIQSSKSRMTLATSSIVAFGGVGSLIIFGYTLIGTLAVLLGASISLGSLIKHRIESSAKLINKNERSVRQKLQSLKFKLDDKYRGYIEDSLDWERKIKKKRELLKSTLDSVFSPTEMTYRRYETAGEKALIGIEDNIFKITEILESIQYLESDENIKIYEEKIPQKLNQIKELSDAYEKVIVSFEQDKVDADHEDVFLQLEDLANRTEKYLNL